MTASVGSAMGLMFAAGPGPFLALCVLITLGALGLQAFAHPGPVFFGACMLILPFVAWRVGRVRAHGGGLDSKRLLIAGGLLFGAFMAYQVQWGTLGGVIHESRAESCRFYHLGEYGPTSRGTSWFLGCMDHLSKDEIRQGCTRLMYGTESRTWKLRLAC
ncbi:hypothetical protein ASF26_01500 [Methylobacterium sp. Leaf93]|nr:hypothetical protein ASF26_01500 [Methylobacterium sp. Leaf93]